VCFWNLLIEFWILRIFWFYWRFQRFLDRSVVIIFFVVVVNRVIIVILIIVECSEIIIFSSIVVFEVNILRLVLIIDFRFLKLFVLSKVRLWFRLNVRWRRHYDLWDISNVIELLSSLSLLRNELLLMIKFLRISIVKVLIWADVEIKFSIVDIRLIESVISLIRLRISVIASRLIEKFRTIVIISEDWVELKLLTRSIRKTREIFCIFRISSRQRSSYIFTIVHELKIIVNRRVLCWFFQITS
jgi:hypothetical protein